MRVVTEPIPTDCGEDSILVAVTDVDPTEAEGAVIATFAAANGLKDKGVAFIEIAGGAVVVLVFGRPKTLVGVLETVTEAVVVWVGVENEKDMGELNPPNLKVRWVGCGIIGAGVVTDAAVDVGAVVVEAEAGRGEPIEGPVAAWKESANNAASVAVMDVGVVAVEIGAVELREEATRLDVETETLGVGGSLVLLLLCSIARSTDMGMVLRTGGPGRRALQNLHLASDLRVRWSHVGHLQVSNETGFQSLSCVHSIVWSIRGL